MGWKDTSSFSRDDTQRIPNSFSLALSPLLRIVVHRHIHHPKNVWLFSCHGLGFEQVVCGTDLEEAKAVALETVLRRAREHVASIEAAIARKEPPRPARSDRGSTT